MITVDSISETFPRCAAWNTPSIISACEKFGHAYTSDVRSISSAGEILIDSAESSTQPFTYYEALYGLLVYCGCSSFNGALTSETKQRKTIPKQIQNNVLFQTLLHVKQNTETIPKRFGIVSELFWAHWHIHSHVEKYANPKTVSASGM